MPGLPHGAVSEAVLTDWVLDGIREGKAMTATWYELRAAGLKCSERRFAKKWRDMEGEVRAYYYDR